MSIQLYVTSSGVALSLDSGGVGLWIVWLVAGAIQDVCQSRKTAVPKTIAVTYVMNRVSNLFA